MTFVHLVDHTLCLTLHELYCVSCCLFLRERERERERLLESAAPVGAGKALSSRILSGEDLRGSRGSADTGRMPLLAVGLVSGGGCSRQGGAPFVSEQSLGGKRGGCFKGGDRVDGLTLVALPLLLIHPPPGVPASSRGPLDGAAAAVRAPPRPGLAAGRRAERNNVLQGRRSGNNHLERRL